MNYQKYYSQLKEAVNHTHWHSGQRTDAPAFLAWSQRTREALVELFGRTSNAVLDFDDLIKDIKNEALADHWKVSVLENFLNDRLDDRNQETTMISTQNTENTYDLAIICAIPDPELAAVQKIGNWSKLPASADDPQIYHQTTWQIKAHSTIRIIAAAPNEMGLSYAAVLAAKMVWRFRPKLVAMAGIAAGSNEEKQGFGDILVPNYTYDYGSSKTVIKDGKIEIKPSPNPIPVSPTLLGHLKNWQATRKDFSHLIAPDWPAAEPNTKLKIHIGPLFSSPTVLDAKAPVTAETQHWRKLIGVEMEAHAVHRATHDTIKPPPMFLCAKSICDFAEGKNDLWQAYAAFTSAQFIYHFLTEEWENITK